jgi:hypothetical protein
LSVLVFVSAGKMPFAVSEWPVSRLTTRRACGQINPSIQADDVLIVGLDPRA